MGLIDLNKKSNLRIKAQRERARAAELKRKQAQLAALNKKRDDENRTIIQRKQQELADIGKPVAPPVPVLSAANQLTAAVTAKQRQSPSSIDIQNERNTRRAVGIAETQAGIDQRTVENKGLLASIQGQTPRVLSPDELLEQTERRATQKQRRESRSANRSIKDIERRFGAGTPESIAKLRALDLKRRDEGKVGLFEGRRSRRDEINADRRRRGQPPLEVRPTPEPKPLGPDTDIQSEPIEQLLVDEVTGEVWMVVENRGRRQLLPTKQDALGNHVLDTDQISQDEYVNNVSQEEVERLTILARTVLGVANPINDVLNKLRDLDGQEPFTSSLGDRLRSGDIDSERERLEKRLRRILWGFIRSGGASEASQRQEDKQAERRGELVDEAAETQLKEDKEASEKVVKREQDIQDDILDQATKAADKVHDPQFGRAVNDTEYQKFIVNRVILLNKIRERVELDKRSEDVNATQDAITAREPVDPTTGLPIIYTVEQRDALLNASPDARYIDGGIQQATTGRVDVLESRSGLKVISTTADYEALPSGTEFIDAGDGKRSVKP